MKFFQAKYFPFWKTKQNKSLAHRDVSGKDRQAQTHVFSSENKISVGENLNLMESSPSIDADMKKFLLFFLVMSFYPLTQKNGV